MMICAGGVYLPHHEIHMVEWMVANNTKVAGKLTYQWTKQEAAMRHVKNWRTAVDAGAHVGTWSMNLERRFASVHAFEPIAEHRACFERNVCFDNKANVVLHPCGLDDKEGTASFSIPPGSSGGTHVNGTGDVPLCRLDSFNLMYVDFMKIDVEGYEYFVLKGGEQTIRRDKPCIVVEQKPKGLAERYGLSRMAAVELLRSWGAVLRFEMSGDYCLSWE